MWWKKFYFDKQDRELLTLVNRVINARDNTHMEYRVFDARLHPHGIKTLSVSLEMRVARAVVKLLDSLAAGQAEDRLDALRALYDEVLNSASTSLRRNTARVLIQIMKELVRAQGDELRQLQLAHQFRRATTGNPRVIRRMLERYHLVEMPEDWSQLSFDHHVHDANTKGRKNPTHLIMDAWIKGIRHLTVIYYNFVDTEAAHEVLEAADIMGISVRIGIEYSASFRGRYVHFIWVPRGFADTAGFLEFLAQPNVCDLMEKGREASAYQQRYVFAVLEKWNSHHRFSLEEEMDIALPPLREEDFRLFVGHGQPSILHLAEYIFQMIFPVLKRHALTLREWQQMEADPDKHAEIIKKINTLSTFDLSTIHDTWLIPENNPDLQSPHVPSNSPDTPELLRLPPMVLLNWFSSLNSGYRITLNLAYLRPEDVLELLWHCQGLITHLEIFNLKEWHENKLVHLQEINLLQQAINRGSAPRLKRIIRDMLRWQEEKAEPDNDRCKQLRAILRNIPTLQSFYKAVPLRSRIGTDSTSRSHKTLGMGMVFPETLTLRGQRYCAKQAGMGVTIPIHVEIHKILSYKPNPVPRLGIALTNFLRRFPGCKTLGYTKEQEWVSHSATTIVGKSGNIAPLGGTLMAQRTITEPGSPSPQKLFHPPSQFYLNTRLRNVLKVLVGFLPAMCAFQYTQQWWVLAWFGPAIWFAITCGRNILQSVMAGQGLYHSTLLRWRSHVSWSRLCDSLMYTGFSVVLLELGIRLIFLQNFLGYTVGNHPVLVYTLISIANGIYLSSHNIYRGLPKEAIIGNMFRSALSIPVSILYSNLLLDGMEAVGVVDPIALLQPSAAIISKTASDSVAALIEGFADSQNNLRMRAWDYSTKIRQVFDTYTRLELLYPEDDGLAILARPKQFMHNSEVGNARIETETIINALDLMYFWLYQPRAQDALRTIVKDMSMEERCILARSQLVLMREKEVSQLFVKGLVGRNFARPLAFYLDRHEEYLRAMMRLCTPTKRS